MNIYVNLGVLRRRNRIVVPKIPKNDLSLLLKSVFSKLKRLGQKQDKRGDPAVRYQYNNTLNREKRAAKIAARFFNTSISRLILDTSQLQSITDSKTLLLAFVITTVKRLSTKGAEYFQTSSLPRNTQAAHPFEAFYNPSSDRAKANQQHVASGRTIRKNLSRRS